MLRNFSWVIDGRLAGMALPSGAYGGPTGSHLNDLEQDLQDLQERGITAVVSLTYRPLPRNILLRFGMQPLHLPVEDMTPPTSGQIHQFIAFVEQTEGGVVVHCTAGVGRTGTMLACYLVWSGMAAEQAIDLIRQNRPGSIETADQEWAVMNFAGQVQCTPMWRGATSRSGSGSERPEGEVRLADGSELERVIDVMAAAFSETAGYDRRADFERRVASDPDGDFVENRVLVVDGTIVSALRIYDRMVRIGHSLVRCAGVGDVATAPEYQGHGHGSRLLRSTVRSLANQEFDLAWLTGRPEFYNRFGWHTCNGRFFELIRVAPAEITDPPCTISPVELSDAYDEVRGIYDRYNETRPCTVDRSPEYWAWLRRYRTSWQNDRSLLLGAHREDRLVGYLLLDQDTTEWRILEVACLPPDNGEVAALIATAGRMAIEANVRRYRGVVPYDETSLMHLEQAGVSARLLNDVPVFGNVMIQILNLKLFLQKIVPELESKLRQAWQGSIAFTTERGDRAVLIVQGNRIGVGEVPVADVEILLSSEDLVHMLLGNRSFQEIRRISPMTLPNQTVSLLAMLFPCTCPVYWGTDYV
ncbi:MAG: GNAT family N-acetyltransferase [Gemmatimonadota bacterium]|nr:GNAT family N-acetyltransferase [Gemmatimonadota bacterium]